MSGRKQRKKSGASGSTNALRQAIEAGLVYEGNPKHKEPWQGRRKGSLWPKEITIEQDHMKQTGPQHQHYGTFGLGDREKFFFQLEFEPSPDEGPTSSDEEAGSWGSFQIWVE